MNIFIVFFISYSLSYLTPLTDCNDATITYYDASGTTNHHCMLKSDYPSGYFTAAASEHFMDGSNKCGVCYEAVGEIGSIRFVITNLCPASGNEGNCDSENVHFDMAEEAFPYLCDKSVGKCEVTYRMVACDLTGNVYAQIKDGSNQWWTAFFIKNYVVGIKKVEISYGNVNKQLTRERSNFFLTEDSNGISFPATLKITSINGDSVSITLNDVTAGKKYYSDKQFEIPKDKYFDPQTLNSISKPNSLQECCSIPDHHVLFDDAIGSAYYSNSYQIVTNDKKTGTSSIKYSFGQWGNSKIATSAHKIATKLYNKIQFYVKSNVNGEINVWHDGDSKKKTIQTTTQWTLHTIPFDEIMTNVPEFFKGIEFQSLKTGTIDYYFDSIELVEIDDVCDEYCSDHISTCSGGNSNNNGGNGGNTNEDTNGGNGGNTDEDNKDDNNNNNDGGNTDNNGGNTNNNQPDKAMNIVILFIFFIVLLI